jgi:hypothetical protein
MRWPDRDSGSLEESLLPTAEAGNEAVQAGQGGDAENGAASGDSQPQLTAFFEGALVRLGQDTEPGAITGLGAGHPASLSGSGSPWVSPRIVNICSAPVSASTLATGRRGRTDATDGSGVDCGIEAVGYQAHDAAGEEHPEMVLDKLVEVVRATGRVGVVGVYNPEDPGAATEDAKHGRYGFNCGLVFDKAISMGHGQCPVKRYNHQLRDLIIRGKARPSLIVSHELPRGGPRCLQELRPAGRRMDQGPAQARTPGRLTAHRDAGPGLTAGTGAGSGSSRPGRLAAGAVPDFYVRREEDRDGGIGRPGCPGHESSRRWRAVNLRPRR